MLTSRLRLYLTTDRRHLGRYSGYGRDGHVIHKENMVDATMAGGHHSGPTFDQPPQPLLPLHLQPQLDQRARSFDVACFDVVIAHLRAFALGAARPSRKW